MNRIGVLFLTSHLPYPPISGGRLREYQIIKNLSKKCDVYICAITKTMSADLQEEKELRRYSKEIKLFRAYQDADNLDSNLLPDQMIRNHSEEAKKYLEYLLTKKLIQVIHCEGYYMLQNIPKSSDAAIVLAEQNIEYSILRQKIEIDSDKKNIEINRSEYEKIYHYECKCWENVDLIIALTSDDYCEIVAQRGKEEGIMIIPNGVDHVQKCTSQEILSENIDDLSKRKYVLYVGNFEYQPNVDAATVLINIIYPRIREKYSDVELFVVGNNGDNRLKEYTNISGVVITGRVTDLMQYYQHALMCIFPLRMGGGIKVKILEALRNNKIVVTTSIGAQGIPCVEASGLDVCNDVEEIISASYKWLEQIEREPNRKFVDNTNIMSRLLNWKESCDLLYQAYITTLKSKQNEYPGSAGV